MELGLAILPGNGAGPAATAGALNLSQTVGERFDHSLSFNEGLIGGVVRDTPGKALGYETSFMHDFEYARA